MRLPIQSMQAIRLRLLGNDEQRWFRSVVIDFDEDRELVVLRPNEKEVAAKDEEKPADAEPLEIANPDTVGDQPLVEESIFKKGTQLEVEISLPDGIRRFTSVVRKLEYAYGGAMRIEWPTEGQRIQRRDYVRVEAEYRTIVWYRDEEENLKQVNGFTIDLSAGGLRLKLPQPLDEELRIEMEVQNPTLKSQTLQGRVVRSSEIEKKRDEPQQYWVAVEFVGVDDRLRKDMTQMVFDIQREQMKRSLS